MSHVYVSLWSLKTEYLRPRSGPFPTLQAWCQLVIQQKLNTLASVVRATYARVRQKNAGQPPKLLLFTAPEFTFANHFALSMLHPKYTIGDFAVDAYQKARISAAIGELASARELSGLLLIPGTTFSKESKTRLLDFHEMPENGLKFSYGKRDMAAYLAPTVTAPVTSTFPERSSFSIGLQNDVISNMKSASESTAKDVAERKLSVDDLVALHNTAYIGYGDSVLEYSKMFPDESEYGEKFTVFVPGKAPGIFTFGETRLGVEICADHANGALATNARDRVDIQLIMSAYASIGEEAVYCKPGNAGVVVHADTRTPSVRDGDLEELETIDSYREADGLPCGIVETYLLS